MRGEKEHYNQERTWNFSECKNAHEFVIENFSKLESEIKLQSRNFRHSKLVLYGTIV